MRTASSWPRYSTVPPIKATWKGFDQKELDGQAIFTIDNETLKYHVEIKNELRSHQLPRIWAMADKYQPLMVAATRLNPKIKEELRQKNIAYIEANGNFYLKNGRTFWWIDANKPINIDKETVSRAFTKTGPKVVFHFLLNETLINKPYRHIAELTDTGIGNVTNIIKGLKQDGYLLTIAKNNYQFQNKQALLNKWMAAYDVRLKPTLKLGTFRFLKTEDFNNWKTLPLDDNTWWGGEPAGDLLTHYLKPAILTLYTNETRNDLIKKYRMVPDEKGTIQVYKKFWQMEDKENNKVVPPLLAYTDLMNTADRRCIETAEKIYNEFLQDRL
ncbi:MAG: hypothetical protein EOO10_25805 [Chitinophagaceae bacterium]|nr:MAG: hypothetical protein EOO10_25805 [Chitinophagaceae bacterium]